MQDEIKTAIRQIVDMIKKPLLAVRSSITRIKAELAVIINKIKKGMLAVKNTVLGLGKPSNNVVILYTILSLYEYHEKYYYDIKTPPSQQFTRKYEFLLTLLSGKNCFYKTVWLKTIYFDNQKKIRVGRHFNEMRINKLSLLYLI